MNNNNTNIKHEFNPTTNLVQEASVCIFLELGFKCAWNFISTNLEVICDTFQILSQQIKTSLLLE
jgi:hypothetical protein